MVLTLLSLLCLTGATIALPLSGDAHRFSTRQAPIAFNKENFAVTRDFPGVSFQIPESYAGLLPVSDRENETSELFFWYYPPTSDAGEDDIVVWLNGGPGCSSLSGALTENGPWLLNEQGEAYENPYSWSNISNIVFIEQPVGTGFSEGTPTADDQTDVAEQFIGFLKNLYKVFPDLQGKKLWLTGESYAGKYIPYLADGIFSLSETDASDNGINLQGIHIIDPSFTADARGFGEDLPAIDFAQKYQETLQLSDTMLAALVEQAKSNGIYNFAATHLEYPPSGPIYTPKEFRNNYTPWTNVYLAVNQTRECFDIYDITADCPLPRDPLGFDGVTQVSDPDNWLNDTPGVKEALHVNETKTWYACSPCPVFVGPGARGDSSAPPDVTVLPGVIEKSNRSIIAHGNQDFILLAEGSALAIQNMTWAGQQGFQERPTADFVVEGESVGVVHTERGLTFATVEKSGHMLPADAPAAGFKLVQYLLGQIDSLEA